MTEETTVPEDLSKNFAVPGIRAIIRHEILDTALEARLRKQIQSTGAASAEEALQRILETQEEQDRWLLENKEAINVKVRRGIEQLDRGEGIPEDQLDAHLARLKAQPE